MSWFSGFTFGVLTMLVINIVYEKKEINDLLENINRKGDEEINE